MFRTARVPLLSLALLLAAAALVYGETLGEIIALVEKRSATMRDMSCRMKMDMDVMGQAVAMEGDLKMALPNKLAMEMDMKMPGMDEAGKMKMVSDGRIMYQEVSAAGRTIVNKVDLEASGMGSAMRGMGRMGGIGGMGGMTGWNPDPAQSLAQLKEMMDVEQKDDEILADGQKAWVIEGKFKPKYYMMMNRATAGAGRDVFRSQMAGLRLYIGQEDQYMNKMEFLSSAKDTVGRMKTTGTMTFEDLKFNQGFPAGTFTYETPEGAVVNDQTETMRKQVASMKTSIAEAGMDEKEPAGEEANEAPADKPTAVLKPGVEAPAFKATTLDGRAVNLAAMRGRPVLVFFWATWHRGSVARLGEVARLQQTHKAAYEVVAFSLDEPTETDAVRKTLKEKDITVTAAMGSDAILDAYWIMEIPSYVLIDAEGKVLASEKTPKDLTQLEEHLAKLLKK